MTSEDLHALQAILDQHRNAGLDTIIKSVREHRFSEDARAALGAHDKTVLRQIVTRICRAYFGSRYASERLMQLSEGDFSFWVYKSGDCALHSEWEGLTLAPDHPFWVKAVPPNSVHCSCYLVGARSETWVLRQGGRFEIMPNAGLFAGVHPDFATRPPIPFATLVSIVLLSCEDHDAR